MIRTARFSFLAKVAAAIAIIAAMDRLFLGDAAGSWIGGFALAWTGALLATRPALRRRPSLAALAIAAGFAVVLAHDPGGLGWMLFWSALSIAALMPRIGRFDDAWRWSLRLAAHGLSGPLAPALDLIRLARLKPRRGGHGPARLAALLALPLGMTALFVALFASANPVIAQALARVRLPGLGEMLFWALLLALIWPSLRPTRWATRAAALLPRADIALPGIPAASLLLSLLLFNIVFAIQNGLDLAFLWSGAPLPPGVTLADYAHRGAYPLIATALLAGLFVLVALKPGSASAADPAIRRLVVLWVAQNLLLVASSILRTLDYVAAYSLTSLRIAALAWMGLVAIGLALICWRMLAGRSAAWLINANALMAALVLSAASIADLEASAAAWNVRHARETSGRGVALDLCYLAQTGPAALLSLVALERRPLPPGFRDRVRHVRAQVMADLARRQADWRSWTWRGRYRLETARHLLGPNPPAAATPLPGMERDCDGTLHPIAAEQPTPGPAAAPAGDPIADAVENTTPPLTGAPSR
ncbi:DUF4173 domain-containing protein [Sphingomonas sp. CBMAI 2297]|uniref:DUF4173 domain-containing protein n=1 Tax=Sphingomonas sp. CBMAI 2297 TaxID=2991720 RepID=UPI0024560749|nr:DUF4173 domain-containing protein [Sphingomonas sp. CBMAI 2297]MDH4742580.1 DUF4173 domain-containing protein [Sphingomonas sp. CBMAI 2297]